MVLRFIRDQGFQNVLALIGTAALSFGASAYFTQERRDTIALLCGAAAVACFLLAVLGLILIVGENVGTAPRWNPYRRRLQLHWPVTISRMDTGGSWPFRSNLRIRFPGYSHSAAFQSDGSELFITDPIWITNDEKHQVALGISVLVGLKNGQWRECTPLTADHPLLANSGTERFFGLPLYIDRGKTERGRIGFVLGGSLTATLNYEAGTTGSGYRSGILRIIITDMQTNRQATVGVGSPYPESMVRLR